MELRVFILLVLLNTLKVYGENEHVHFKIYVPEIIKHHTHTRAVFIHVHYPPKKKKHHGNVHFNNHHENWNSYSLYKNHDGYAIDQGGPMYQDVLTNNHLSNGDMYNHPVPPIPFYDDYKSNSESAEDAPDPTTPSYINYGDGVTGHSYPPQYDTHENNDNISQNDVGSYENVEHEEGHNAGHEVKTGHVYTDEMNKFYGDKHVESSEKYAGGSNEENYRYYGDRYMSNMAPGQGDGRQHNYIV